MAFLTAFRGKRRLQNAVCVTSGPSAVMFDVPATAARSVAGRQPLAEA